MRKPKQLQSPFAVYEVGKLLGQGGAGYVYAVKDDTAAELAAKVLDPMRATRDRIKRFENEYRFCSQNRHSNVISVSDYGLTDTGAPFFIMPKYHSSLRPYMGCLETANALEVFGHILNGVEAAHLKGVIHRDLKPENILINKNVDRVVICDFGIARFTSEDLFTAVETQDGTRLANFQYAAPEQRQRGSQVDGRTDIYALGLILNELFTGKLAHGTNYILVSAVHRELGYIDPIVERMLQQDPTRRFGSIDELKKELQFLRAEWVTRQKLSALDNVVIPEAEIDDPLLVDPPKIESVDWKDGVLSIRLHRFINDNWLWALNNMGEYSSVFRKGPEAFQVSGKEARIGARSSEAEAILKHFKDWLPRVNQVYENKVKSDAAEKQQREEEKIEREKARTRERLEVLRKLKI